MTVDEYRAEAERLRHAAQAPWALPEARQTLLSLAAAYDRLAKLTETLAKPPLG